MSGAGGTDAVTIYQFGVDVSAVPGETGLAVLFERCDDAAVEYDAPAGRTRVRFDRVAPSLVDAVVSAVRELDRAGFVVVRVVPDEDLVTAAGLGAWLGRSTATVVPWLLGAGAPRPTWRCAGQPVYRWTAIAAWLRSYADPALSPADAARSRAGPSSPGGPSSSPVGPAGAADAAAVEAVNLALRLRALAPRIGRMGLIRSLIVG